MPVRNGIELAGGVHALYWGDRQAIGPQYLQRIQGRCRQLPGGYENHFGDLGVNDIVFGARELVFAIGAAGGCGLDILVTPHGCALSNRQTGNQITAGNSREPLLLVDFAASCTECGRHRPRDAVLGRNIDRAPILAGNG